MTIWILTWKPKPNRETMFQWFKVWKSLKPFGLSLNFLKQLGLNSFTVQFNMVLSFNFFKQFEFDSLKPNRIVVDCYSQTIISQIQFITNSSLVLSITCGIQYPIHCFCFKHLCVIWAIVCANDSYLSFSRLYVQWHYQFIPFVQLREFDGRREYIKISEHLSISIGCWNVEIKYIQFIPHVSIIPFSQLSKPKYVIFDQLYSQLSLFLAFKCWLRE